MLQVVSYQIADSIDIKSFKAFFKTNVIHSDSDEIIFIKPNRKDLYIFLSMAMCVSLILAKTGWDFLQGDSFNLIAKNTI